MVYSKNCKFEGYGQTIKPDDIHIDERYAKINITVQVNDFQQEVKWNLYGSSRKLAKGGKTDLSDFNEEENIKNRNSLLSKYISEYYKFEEMLLDFIS